MSREELIKFVASEYGIMPEFLWDGDKITCTFRHLGTKKWFGILMAVPGNKIGLKNDESVDIINVKLEPEFIQELLSSKKHQIFPAWHMNKRHWVTILLGKNNDCALTQSLIHESFCLTN